MLRVLFHTGNYHHIGHNARICIVLTASLEENNNKRKNNNNNKQKQGPNVSQICSFEEGDESRQDGTCLSQLTLPSHWWPSFTMSQAETEMSFDGSGKFESSGKFVKQPKVMVNVKYSVFETRAGTPCDAAAVSQNQGLYISDNEVTGKNIC